jgi:tetratricopeptide (TPR) repeat protein
LRLLRAPIEPPRDAKMRAQIDDLRRRATVAKALHDTGRNQRAVEEGQRLVAEARALGYAPLLAELLALTGWFQEAATFDARAIKIWEEAIWMGLRTKRDDLAAEAAAILSGMVGGNYPRNREEGERWADLADALADRLGDGHERLRSWIAQSRAMIEESTDPEGALRLTLKALELKRKVLPPDDPDIASSLVNEANQLHLAGRDAAAAKVAEEADRILIAAYGPSHSLVAVSQSNHGEFLVALGRPAEALALFRVAAFNWEAQVGPDHPFPAYPLTGLGRALLALGRPAEARPPLERALRLRERHDPEPALLAETRFALAQALWATGEHRRAVNLATTARQEFAKAPTGERAGKEVAAWLTDHKSHGPRYLGR